MTFRLTTLMYLFALVAASLAAFGASGGIAAVFVVVVFWAAWFYAERTLLLLLAIGLAVLTLLLLPAVQPARESSPRNRCLNNMKLLLLAIQYYDDAHGELPPAFGAVEGHKAAQSWRVHILPTMEGNTIAPHYNYDEPWDGPTNGPKFAAVEIYEHVCWEHGAPPETLYFAITGSQTIWGDGEPRTFDDVSDDLGNTIMLIEAAGRGVHWSEPSDLTFDEAVELLTTPLPDDDSDGHRINHGYFYRPHYIRLVAMCDGSARALPVPIPREAAVALLTANGGEQLDPQWTEFYPPAKIDYGRIWGFSLFVLLAVLPGVPKVRPWIWPQSANDSTLRKPNSALDQ